MAFEISWGGEDKNFKDTKEGVNMNHSRKGRVLARPYKDTRKWQERRKSLLLIQLGYRTQLKQMIREFRVWPGSKAESEVKISIEEEPVAERNPWASSSRANSGTWKVCARQMGGWVLTFLPALAYFLSCKCTLNKLSLVLLLAICLCLIFVVLGTQNPGYPGGYPLGSGIWQQ